MNPARWRFATLASAMVALSLSCAPPRSAGTPHTSTAPVTQGAAQADPQQAWVLKGILRQVGSYPHIEMVVSGQTELFGKGDYYVVGPLQKEITALAPGRITVKGTLMRKELELAGSSGRKRLRLEVEVTEYQR